MVGKPGSRFAPPLPNEMDQRMARRYARLIRAKNPRWDVRVVNIAQGLNHIHIMSPGDPYQNTWIIRTPTQAEECLT